MWGCAPVTTAVRAAYAEESCVEHGSDDCLLRPPGGFCLLYTDAAAAMIEGVRIELGQTLRWNFYFGGHLSTVSPVRVVEHTEHGLLLWLATGSPVWRADLPDGAHLRDIPPEDRPVNGYPLRVDRWRQGSALIYQPIGAAHAVWWLFSKKRLSRRPLFQGWYVNLERRVRRGEDIDISDLELDIAVASDRSWRWKDERSFTDKIGHPAYWTAEEAAAIRDEGHRVAQLAETGRFPFDGSWCDFAPPSEWSLPELPAKPTTSLLRTGS
ncbi:DUF402 domain-containing protein [Microtetraspora sp. NBRC 16547]|uniref:DUF402 domain-containing protein n=1 Tax=Microtetraspora sp. NBRC 16547 TaxID=3030993 RepID=UPI0024A415F0|nr:DUF402 domain-containing protein [Microtetraspora sp. NBRC 16547]GLW99189.1 hypothetical protein Misp02_32760 [Microtetraspora sp. NBRC 16547]